MKFRDPNAQIMGKKMDLPVHLEGRGEHHQTAGDVVTVLLVLALHGGVLTTAAVSKRTEIHRDTARRILRELASHGWVEQLERDEVEYWALGPELPRLGLDYQARKVAAAQALSSTFQRLVEPLLPTAGEG